MKNKILKLLKNNKEFLSGEQIAGEFGVTRSAIWKNINLLKEDGYEISSISNKGYKLISTPDILTFEEIEDYLTTKYIGRNIYYYKSIGSTNTRAKEIACKEKEGTIIISEEQTQGRGRMGRNWESSKGKGIYMSIILKPNLEPMKISKLTLIGAAAVHRGLSKINIESGIKWPNDIIIDDRKICGILTEMNCEVDIINYVVLGIGINVNLDESHLPDTIKDKATSLKIVKGREVDRKVLVANILNEFEVLYDEFVHHNDTSKTLKICKENSILLNKEVSLIRGVESRIGKVLDINDDGELVVEFATGVENILSGEVSIRSTKDGSLKF